MTHKDPPLLIPSSALIVRSGEPRVATLGGDNNVRFQVVQLGDYGTKVEVVEGLSEKRAVLIAPPDDLQDGETVRVVDSRAGKDGKELTTESPVRLSRNRNSEYLPAKTQRAQSSEIEGENHL